MIIIIITIIIITIIIIIIIIIIISSHLRIALISRYYLAILTDRNEWS